MTAWHRTVSRPRLFTPHTTTQGAQGQPDAEFPPIPEQLCHFYQVFSLGGPQGEIDEAPLLGDCNEKSLGDKELWAVKWMQCR